MHHECDDFDLTQFAQWLYSFSSDDIYHVSLPLLQNGLHVITLMWEMRASVLARILISDTTEMSFKGCLCVCLKYSTWHIGLNMEF